MTSDAASRLTGESIVSGRAPHGGRALAAFGVLELAAFVLYMMFGRGLWFYADEWEFLAARTGGNLGDLFRPHVVHLVTLPILAYRLMWWLVGLRMYWPYQTLIIVLHSIGALLARTVMCRAGVRPWTASVVASLLLFFGHGYQDILWPFQITLVGSLVFGFAHLLLADHTGPLDRRDWAGLVAGLAAMLCSGLGITMVFIVGIATLLRRGWRIAVVHTAPLEALYLLWFVTLARTDYEATRRAKGSPTISQAVRFVGGMFSNTFRALGDIPAASVALLVVLIAGLVVAWLPMTRQEFRACAALPVGLLLGAFAFVASTGLERATWGPPSESRYLYVVAFLVLPVIAVAADALMLRWRAIAPVVLALFVIGIPGNLRAMADYTKRQREGQRLFREMILTLPRVPIAQRAPPWQPTHAGLFKCVPTIGWLVAGVASGRIPAPHDVGAEDVAQETLRMSIVVSPPCPHERYPRPLFVPQTCMQVFRPMSVRLREGESLTVRNGIIRLAPQTATDGTDLPVIVGGGAAPRTIIATAAVRLHVARDSQAHLFAATGGGGELNGPVPASRKASPTLCGPSHAFVAAG